MNRELLKVCLISMFLFIASDIVLPLVPQYASTLGLAPGTIGVLVSMYAFFPFLLAIPAGALTDRFGTRRMLLLGATGSMTAALLFALADSAVGLFAAEVLAGLAHFVIIVSLQVHVSLLPIDRDLAFGYFTLAGALGMTVGPVLGGLLTDHAGFGTAFLTAAGAAGVLGTVVISLHEIRTRANGRRISLSSSRERIQRFTHNRGIIMAMVASFSMLFALALVPSYFPLYLSARSLTASAIGLLISLQSGAATLVRVVLHWGVQRWGRRSLLAVALIMGGMGIGLTPLMVSFPLLAAAALVMGLGKGLSQPLSMVLVADSTEDGERGLAMAFRLMGNRLGNFLSPLFFGLIVTYVALEPVFFIAGAIPLAAAGAIFSWIRAEPSFSARPVSAEGSTRTQVQQS